MMATRLFHECPLIVMITTGRLPAPSASQALGKLPSPSSAPEARIGMKLHNLLLATGANSLPGRFTSSSVAAVEYAPSAFLRVLLAPQGVIGERRGSESAYGELLPSITSITTLPCLPDARPGHPWLHPCDVSGHRWRVSRDIVAFQLLFWDHSHASSTAQHREAV
jgi:hypothetical protein